MKIILFLTYLFTDLYSLDQCFLRHLKKIEHTAPINQIGNIDYIYLVNLDQRSERFENCLSQLMPYGISPQRFSAIYGWNLSKSVLEDVGFKFLPGMPFNVRNNGIVLTDLFEPKATRLTPLCYGKVCFAYDLKPGAVGCTLSHLSILKDAYDSGYETIWILEDDICVNDNPHLLADLIDLLDRSVGRENWDILYTDSDRYFKSVQEITRLWRPDMPDVDLTQLVKHQSIGPHFIKIGSRAQTHSMIISRSGMKKILDFEMSYGIFLPYDHEVSFIPNIHLYALKQKIVSVQPNQGSDTDNNHFD